MCPSRTQSVSLQESRGCFNYQTVNLRKPLTLFVHSSLRPRIRELFELCRVSPSGEGASTARLKRGWGNQFGLSPTPRDTEGSGRSTVYSTFIHMDMVNFGICMRAYALVSCSHITPPSAKNNCMRWANRVVHFGSQQWEILCV
ncbi:hypothetical protein CEXT_568111 [Caerostris extrusa]|uniref:Uncharacterized protein n=1 Tax=Caerostris extrusa TaxID=172846 RepID=A0AAV4VPM0_CAEEX|nr:hypothetical protein CEXT_568111 [Caerostris extrusa]